MALMLGRRPGEKVHIIDDQGNEAVIEVIKPSGEIDNFIRLRITAPQSMRIVRGEIHSGNNSE